LLGNSTPKHTVYCKTPLVNPSEEANQTKRQQKDWKEKERENGDDLP
jgi:hypothetical protein